MSGWRGRDRGMFDVCVIGGGPAGLTAALYLARYHLAVSLVDSGRSRALLIPRTHNQPFWEEGIAGQALVERMRSHVARYPVTVDHDTVERVQKLSRGFAVRTRTRAILARTVLVATGVENRRPSMGAEDHAAALRRGLLRYCPICDGYEVTDHVVGLVGRGSRLFGEAKFLRSYTASVTVFAEQTSVGLSIDQRSELSGMGIRVVDTSASDYRLGEGSIEVLFDSAWQAFDTVYAALGSNARCEVIRDLVPDLTVEGCLVVDAHQRTSVGGLYAAGDVVAGVDQIAHAIGQASVAATAIRNDLCGEVALIRRVPDAPKSLPNRNETSPLKEDDRMTSKDTVEGDARGQFAESQADPQSDGVANAIPTKVVREDDATLYKSEKKPSPNPGFDIRTQTNKRD